MYLHQNFFLLYVFIDQVVLHIFFFFSLPESYGQAALRLHQSRYQVTGQIFIDILSLDI